MKKRDKRDTIIVSIALIIVLVIFGVSYITKAKTIPNVVADDELINCIASKSKVYVSATCPHCANQKEILGDYIASFEIIECLSNPLACQGIQGVPTWEINGERYPGVKSIAQLKQLAGC